MAKKRENGCCDLAQIKPILLNLKTMRLCHNTSAKAQVIKYVHEVLDLDPIVNPVFSYFLKNLLHLGPSTDLHDLHTSIL